MNHQRLADAIVNAYLPDTPAKPIPDYTRLSHADIALALKLRDEGKTQTVIAQLIGCSQPTISDLLKAFSDTRPLAKLKAHNSALRLVDRVIDKADVEESLEVLDRIGVLEKRQDSGKGSQVNIVIGMPGQPAGPDVAIEVLSPSVSPVMHSLSAEPEQKRKP